MTAKKRFEADLHKIDAARILWRRIGKGSGRGKGREV